MKDTLLKLFPYAIIGFTLWQSFGIFEDETERTEMLEMQVGPAESAVVKLQRRIKAVKDSESKIAEYEERLNDLKKQMEALKTKMPPDEDKTAVLQELRNSAQSINIKDVTFNPGAKKDNGIYFSNGIDIKGHGTFLQFLLFLEQSYSGKRLININKLKMTASPTQSKGRFFFVDVETLFETYEYNTNYVPPAPAPTPANGSKGS